MNITKKVHRLSLPENSFIVVGSGILSALGIRESNDIDLIVSDELFEQLKKQGWKIGSWPDQAVLTKDNFDIGTHWSGLSVNELLINATVIDGIPFLGLNELRAWKLLNARPKDISDVALIDKYLMSN